MVDLILSDDYISTVRILNPSKDKEIRNILTIAGVSVLGKSVRNNDELIVFNILRSSTVLFNLLEIGDISYEFR